MNFNTKQGEKLTNFSQTSENEMLKALFKTVKNAAKNIPAYKLVLEESKIDFKLRNFSDFLKLPILTKANYCLKYPINQRCLNGNISNVDFFAVSSGTTGEPLVWGRSLIDEKRSAFNYETIFRYSFQAHKIKTLVVICFPLGSWIGGLHAVSCLRILKVEGYNISIIAPGNNTEEIIRAVQKFNSVFKQIVLIGYPPSVRSTIDQGAALGINWASYNTKFVFAGESISEQWRNAIHEKVNTTMHLFTSASMYGTADAGVIANETPLSISIRKYLTDNHLFEELFGQNRIPALFQYNPTQVYFESVNNEIVFTVNGSNPLIRYNIKDTGAIITYDRIMEFVQNKGYKTPEALKTPLLKNTFRFPFVYIYGRSDHTVSYYGANIYSESISECLNEKTFRNLLTGKFVMKVVEAKMSEKELHLIVEKKLGVESTNSLKNHLEQFLLKSLQIRNSEFKNYIPIEKQKIQVFLKEFQEPTYFNPIGKHKYS